MNLNNIQNPINKEMDDFKKLLKQSISSDNIIIDEIINYLIKRKGKQIRPILVFLTAGLCGKISKSTQRAAILIEILHTATLIHDDIVDDSNYRRGYFSINAIWKNKYSVLVGDYLLSSGLNFSLNNNDFDFLKVLSSAVKKMSEGEIIQFKKTKSLDIDEKTYFKIIQKKTASLFISCCEMGAISSYTSNKNINLMKKLGLYLGLAFQIKDDLFAYNNSNFDKPSLNDILQKKITLPLIYSLKKSNQYEKNKILSYIKNESNLSNILNFVNEKGGVDYAKSKMNYYINDANRIVNLFPSSKYKTSLFNLLKFFSQRGN